MTDAPASSLSDTLQALFHKEFIPTIPHAGYETLRKRYLENGHKDRLIESYSRIIPSLAKTDSVLLMGASPLEGFILRRTVPDISLKMIGSPESLLYRSPEEYDFFRQHDVQRDGELHSVERHNIETSLPLPDASFDTIVCLEVLEHLRRDPLFTLCEMRRLLKTGGTLFLSTPNINSARSVRRALQWENPMFFPSFGPPPMGILHAHEYSVREVLLLLDRAGFTPRELSSFNHVTLDSFDHDARYRCGGSVPFPIVEEVDASSEALFEKLKDHPLRGDYLFIQAVGEHRYNPEPIDPIYCSLE